MIVWSYGGGTQSIAIAALIAQGRLPRPDVTIFADTGWESTETFQWMGKHILPLFASLDLSFHIAGHDLATVDLYSHKGKLLIPAYTETGKLPTFCSSEWKALVVRRYLTQYLGINARRDKITMWLGMSTDEVERLKQTDEQWIQHEWPLCFLVNPRMNRNDCKVLIREFFGEDGPKSSCVFCPHRRNPQWQHQKDFFPLDHQKAVAIGKLIHANDKRGGVWLHESRKHLDEIDFSKDDSQPELFGCESGHCFV